jgi:hypothetical protein
MAARALSRKTTLSVRSVLAVLGFRRLIEFSSGTEGLFLRLAALPDAGGILPD